MDASWMGWACHCEQLDEIVSRVMEGETSITFTDDLTAEDLNYIQFEIERRLN